MSGPRIPTREEFAAAADAAARRLANQALSLGPGGRERLERYLADLEEEACEVHAEMGPALIAYLRQQIQRQMAN